MTHHQHDHDHNHDDHHHHDHHHHSRDESPEMGMKDKLAKLLEHWMKHGEEHAKTYEMWGERATSNDIARVDLLLKKAAEKTRAINEDFRTALEALQK